MPGSRTAVNISGLSVDEIHRGDVLCLHGHYEPTRRLDVRLRLLADVSPLAHATQVKLFTGAAETVSTARLLEGDLLRAGDEAWAQLELREPVVVAPGDRFVLRRPSPAETLGGGTIVDALPKSRHRRRDATVLARLESLTLGTPPEQLLQAAMVLGPASLREIVARSRLDPQIAESALDDLLASGSLLLLEEGNPSPAADLLGIPAANWQLLTTRLTSELEAYHREYPLRRGMPREELKSRLRLQPHAFNAVIDFASRSPSPDLLVDSNRWIALPGHTVDFTAAQRAKADALLARFAAAPFAPPSVRECRAELGDEVYAALVDSEQLVPVSADIVFRRTDYDGIVERVQEYLSRSDRMTVAEARDLLATSRKYVLPLLEHLDATGVTLREGDYRRLRR
jgi:selenocysteine-specific elongation factor